MAPLSDFPTSSPGIEAAPAPEKPIRQIRFDVMRLGEKQQSN